MKEQIEIRTLEREEQEQAAGFLFSKVQNRLMREGHVLAAYEDGVLCGALGAVQEEEQLALLSIYVDEGCRRIGVGTALLRQAVQLAKQLGLAGLWCEYTCSPVREAALEAFFVKSGFLPPMAGVSQYVVKLEDLEKCRLAQLKLPAARLSDDIRPVDEMPAEVRDIVTGDQKKLPPYLSLKAAPGRPVRDLCLVCAHGRELRAYVICTDINGMLYLHAAYLSKSRYAVYMTAMLQQIMKKIQNNYDYDRVTITGARDRGKRLVHYFLEGVPMEEKTSYETSCLAEE